MRRRERGGNPRVRDRLSGSRPPRRQADRIFVLGDEDDDEDVLSVHQADGVLVSASTSLHHERVVSVFQRWHGRDECEGTGIGLAMCRRIAETHGGTVWCESAPGQGATFHVRLPAGSEPR